MRTTILVCEALLNAVDGCECLFVSNQCTYLAATLHPNVIDLAVAAVEPSYV